MIQINLFTNRLTDLENKLMVTKAKSGGEGQIRRWELDYKKAEHQRIKAIELWYWRRFLRVPWTARRSNQSILKEISPDFIGRTDVEAETPILWSPDAKSWLIWKHPDAGKDWRQEEKGTTEHEMVRWHHRLNGHGFMWTLGVGNGHGGLACCGS